MAELLSHPLVVLFIGALLSGLLIPAITRSWQNHQKALEIKTSLVSELSEALMEIMLTVQFVHLGSTSVSQEEFDGAYRSWETKSAVIGTKLQAYFPDTSIPRDWTDFSEVVTGFYALEGTPEGQKSRAREDLSAKLNQLLEPKNQVRPEWAELKAGVFRKKAEFIQRILNSRIALLESSVFSI